MSILLPFLALLLVGAIAAYHRLSLLNWVIASAVGVLLTPFIGAGWIATTIALVDISSEIK